MPERRVYDKKFKYSGILNFQDFYRSIKSYWVSKGFSFDETTHEETLKEDGSRDIKVQFSISKEVTDYVKYKGTISLSASGIIPVILDHGTYKEESNKIDSLSIEIQADIETDYGGLFEGKPFSKFLRGLFEKYIVKSEIKELTKEYVSICEEFMNFIKEKTSSFRI